MHRFPQFLSMKLASVHPNKVDQSAFKEVNYIAAKFAPPAIRGIYSNQTSLITALI
jgi:hypothetical protein